MEKETTLTQPWEISTTVPNEEIAEAIARDLLAHRVAGCVQIHGPIRSLYPWQGKVQSDIEWKLFIKTVAARLDACLARLGERHPYQVPEISARPIPRLNPEYQAWLSAETTPSTDWLAPPTAPFHIRMAMAPASVREGPKQLVLGREVVTLHFDEGPAAIPLTLEEFLQRTADQPCLQIELDGFFSWRSSTITQDGRPEWRLDGQFHERLGKTESIELKGNCDANSWQEFCRWVGGVEYEKLVIQCLRTGWWVRCLEMPS